MVVFFDAKGGRHEALLLGNPAAQGQPKTNGPSCTLPEKEISVFVGRAGEEVTRGLPVPAFLQHFEPPLPTLVDRKIRETDTGGVDECWNSLSASEKRTRIWEPMIHVPIDKRVWKKHTKMEGGLLVWGPDIVGIENSFRLDYLRHHAFIPCKITIHQVMQIECPDGGWQTYSRDDLVITVGAGDVISQRGEASSLDTPSSPQKP